ncbi:hypothetical protein [Endothiovibrio diazotrophicus]
MAKGTRASSILLALGALASTVLCAGPRSANYHLAASVMDAAGGQRTTATRRFVDALGQPAAALSVDSTRALRSGFIPQTPFQPLFNDRLVTSIQEALTAIAQLPGTSTQEARRIDQAIDLLNRVLADFDAGRFTQGLNEIRQAILDLEKVGPITEPYQRILAKAAEVVVTTEINVIASTAGDTNPFVIGARTLVTQGLSEWSAGDYRTAVNTFKDAYQQATLA